MQSNHPKNLKFYIFIFLQFIFTHLSIFAQQKNSSVLSAPDSLVAFLNKDSVWGKQYCIGETKNGKKIFAYYYNYSGDQNALVLGGVHGSEFYGVDVAYAIKDSLDNLKTKKSKYRILVIPELFVENVAQGRKEPFTINYGRTSCSHCYGSDKNCKLAIDPNRQMPKLNTIFTAKDSISNNNKIIEIENRYLLYLTQVYNPGLIISLHCKNTAKKEEIGIYADPRTNHKNIALGFTKDSILIAKMALHVSANYGIAYGNFKQTNTKTIIVPTYPQDPKPVPEGKLQLRNGYHKNEITFGTWASTEVNFTNKLIKKAATTITVELPQFNYFFKKTFDWSTLQEDILEKNTNAYVQAILLYALEIK